MICEGIQFLIVNKYCCQNSSITLLWLQSLSNKYTMFHTVAVCNNM